MKSNYFTCQQNREKWKTKIETFTQYKKETQIKQTMRELETEWERSRGRCRRRERDKRDRDR